MLGNVFRQDFEVGEFVGKLCAERRRAKDSDGKRAGYQKAEAY
jgi:hypothetical protein